MTFQLKSKNIFLTYPQCTATREELLEHLQTLLRDNSLTYVVIGLETHQDGSPHLHCYLNCEEQVRTRNKRFFDFRNFHPNIQSSRNVKSTIRYVKKDGNFIEHGNCPVSGPSGYQAALQASTAAEAIAIIKETSAKDYILNSDRIDSWIRKAFPPPTTAFTPRNLQEFTLPEEVKLWNDQRKQPGNS